MASNNEQQRIKALKNYVRNQPPPNKKRTERRLVDDEYENVEVNVKTISERIQEIVDHLEPRTTSLTVYRGQPPPHTTISPRWWFSTSTSAEIARRDFSNVERGCCVFTIHVQPGVKVLDVNKFLEPFGGTHHDDEKEYIVDHDGFFYQDEAQTVEGFRDDGHGRYTTFYFPTRRASAPTASNEKINQIIEEFYDNEKELLGDVESANSLRESILAEFSKPSNAAQFSIEKVKAVFNRKKGTRRMRHGRQTRRKGGRGQGRL